MLLAFKSVAVCIGRDPSKRLYSVTRPSRAFATVHTEHYMEMEWLDNSKYAYMKDAEVLAATAIADIWDRNEGKALRNLLTHLTKNLSLNFFLQDK